MSKLTKVIRQLLTARQAAGDSIGAGAVVVVSTDLDMYYGKLPGQQDFMASDGTDSKALNRFLEGVERRAFRMAQIATGNSDQAMEIVQDAMLSLVKNYRHKNEDNWGPLFHTILQSRIRDWYRRSSVRNRLFGWLASEHDRDSDPIQQVEDIHGQTPLEMAGSDNNLAMIVKALKALPLRQQQTFLLRAWEGYSTKETADILRCSSGTIKTHYSRAVHTLRDKLTKQAGETEA